MKKDKLTLKTLIITNFKGIKNFVLDVHERTEIYGENGTGKTTLVDAYRWLLTGKNSNDQNVFEIKPINADGTRTQKVENEVEGVFDFNGKEITLKRINREKWTTARGEETPVFRGNETAYFWNDVPLKESEYKAKVSSMIPEERLKLLTDTVYFNSLKWQTRREILTEITGEVTDQHVLDQIASLLNKDEIGILTSIINSGKTFKERKDELASKRKTAKDELKLIPSRIDEVKRGLPKLDNLAEAESAVKDIQSKIDDLDNQISDSNKAYESSELNISNKRKEIFQLKQYLSDIENGIRSKMLNRNSVGKEKIEALKQEISKIKTKSTELENAIRVRQNLKENAIKRISELETLISSRSEKVESLKNRWISENGKQLTFEEGAFDCPCCSRPLDPGNIEAKKQEMIESFAKSKKEQLDIITKEATAEKNQVARDKSEIDALNAVKDEKNKEISDLNIELSGVMDNLVIKGEELSALEKEESDKVIPDPEKEVIKALAANNDYIEASKKIEALSSEVSEFKPIDHSETIQKKRELKIKLDSYNDVINQKKQVEAGNKRITELEDQQSHLAQTIAAYEHEEFIIQKFISRKSAITEERVNGLFSFVTFRMFDKTIDGNEFDVCDTLINGVPYNDANTASKINAGLDIINVLSSHYGFTAPVWIDNRESVTEIISTRQQVISLIVSPEHSQLTIKQ
ncbi:AAA family ATPase [Albibacterium profundi]|uniref:AAA family ATPase n=1 Tax=Albibacterium profundi TaxID=3134906 RepID=A0ABV5CEV7_9SPHI